MVLMCVVVFVCSASVFVVPITLCVFSSADVSIYRLYCK